MCYKKKHVIYRLFYTRTCHFCTSITFAREDTFSRASFLHERHFCTATAPSIPTPIFNPYTPMRTFVQRHTTIRRKPVTSVYVRGLADDVGDDKLREKFQRMKKSWVPTPRLFCKQIVLFICVNCFLENSLNFFYDLLFFTFSKYCFLEH